MVSLKNHEQEEPFTMQDGTVGLDLTGAVSKCTGFMRQALDNAERLRPGQVLPFFERLGHV